MVFKIDKILPRGTFVNSCFPFLKLKHFFHLSENLTLSVKQSLLIVFHYEFVSELGQYSNFLKFEQLINLSLLMISLHKVY